MALIYIKRKREPIEVSNDRARKIKQLRFGDPDGSGNNKAEPTEMIDLGDEWAGELGQIVSVEMTKERPVAVKQNNEEVERLEQEARLRALPIEKRVHAIGFGFFKLSWWMRSGQREKEPPEAVMSLAEKAALDYLKEHKDATQIASNVYEPILTKYWGKREPTTLADKMRVIHKPEEN